MMLRKIFIALIAITCMTSTCFAKQKDYIVIYQDERCCEHYRNNDICIDSEDVVSAGISMLLFIIFVTVIIITQKDDCYGYYR